MRLERVAVSMTPISPSHLFLPTDAPQGPPPQYSQAPPQPQYYPQQQQAYPAGPPQQYAVAQPYQQGTQVVVIEQGYAPGFVGFGRLSTPCVCFNCHQSVSTNVSIAPGGGAWLACLALAFVGLCVSCTSA